MVSGKALHRLWELNANTWFVLNMYLDHDKEWRLLKLKMASNDTVQAEGIHLGKVFAIKKGSVMRNSH